MRNWGEYALTVLVAALGLCQSLRAPVNERPDAPRMRRQQRFTRLGQRYLHPTTTAAQMATIDFGSMVSDRHADRPALRARMMKRQGTVVRVQRVIEPVRVRPSLPSQCQKGRLTASLYEFPAASTCSDS